MNNAQSPLNARLLKMQNANSAQRGVWERGYGGTGHYSYAMSARWQRCLLPAAATASKVSKFISNNYVAINKPMPAIKGGRRATGNG